MFDKKVRVFIVHHIRIKPFNDVEVVPQVMKGIDINCMTHIKNFNE